LKVAAGHFRLFAVAAEISDEKAFAPARRSGGGDWVEADWSRKENAG
jgi:hypothetical protein